MKKINWDKEMTEKKDEDLETSEDQVQENLTIMRRYFDLLFTKDLKPMLDLFDDNVEWHTIPTGDVIRGKKSLAKNSRNHWAASPDRIKNLMNLFASEDYACIEYISGGTLTGEVDFGSIKIPPSGLKYSIQCCFVFHIKDGKIDRVHEYFDMNAVKNISGFYDGSVKKSSLNAVNPKQKGTKKQVSSKLQVKVGKFSGIKKEK